MVSRNVLGWHGMCNSTGHNQLEGGMMINDSKVYYDAGYKAGQAMSRRDVGLYNHMRDWYRKAQRLENDADKTLAGTAWDQGYSDGRGI